MKDRCGPTLPVVALLLATGQLLGRCDVNPLPAPGVGLNELLDLSHAVTGQPEPLVAATGGEPAEALAHWPRAADGPARPQESQRGLRLPLGVRWHVATERIVMHAVETQPRSPIVQRGQVHPALLIGHLDQQGHAAGRIEPSERGVAALTGHRDRDGAERDPGVDRELFAVLRENREKQGERESDKVGLHRRKLLQEARMTKESEFEIKVGDAAVGSSPNIEDAIVIANARGSGARVERAGVLMAYTVTLRPWREHRDRGGREEVDMFDRIECQDVLSAMTRSDHDVVDHARAVLA